MTEPPSEIDFGPRRIRLTPARWGWHSVVCDDWLTSDPPWWRPTRAWARRAAQRYLRREQAREARKAQAVEEAP